MAILVYFETNKLSYNFKEVAIAYYNGNNKCDINVDKM